MLRLISLYLLLTAACALALVPMILTISVLVGQFHWQLVPLFFSCMVGGIAMSYAIIQIRLFNRQRRLDIADLEVHIPLRKEE